MRKNNTKDKKLHFLIFSLFFTMLAVLVTVSITQAQPASPQQEGLSYSTDMEISSFDTLEGIIPVAIPTAIEHPVKEGVNTCYDCHYGWNEEQKA